MKKRLDIQSLLEDSQKEDLVRFLKSHFVKNSTLADDFLIHFASTFELDESEFHLITDRIVRMFPRNLSNLTHRQANMIKAHLNDLLEQTRDCQSREDYRQAFMIVSHLILLLDLRIDQIPDKYRFIPLLDKCYLLLDGIFGDSPAPSLKTKMRQFLQELITGGKALPLVEMANPYMILLQWVKDSPEMTGKLLVNTLQAKILQYPQFRKEWLFQQVQILVGLNMDKELLSLILDNGENKTVYQAMHRYLNGQKLDNTFIQILKSQYEKQENREVKYRIYQILRSQPVEWPWNMDLAIREYFYTGDVTILDDLLTRSHIEEGELVAHIESYIRDNPGLKGFYLYSAYKYLDQGELLKDHLLQERNVFEILPFLSIVYPLYKEDIENKMAELIESYLRYHFGRPAIDHINDVLDEINRLAHYSLIDYLLLRIRNKFGHRKHFQKLMKELVQ